MEKREKQWRKYQGWLRFKSRIVRFAGCNRMIRDKDGRLIPHPFWFQLATHKSCFVYKSTGTPCSCHLCKGERYNRLRFKKESKRIIREAFE